MRKFWSTLVLLIATASLAACGSDSGAFTTPGSSTATAATVTALSVAPSAATIPPDGTTVTLTATATGSGNVAVSGAAVTFAASMGTIAVTSGTTSATGQATATLSAAGLTAGTVITITATSGSTSGKTTVTVAKSTQTLTLSTSVPQIPSASASTPATITALLVDANNNVVSGSTVSFQATSGALTVTQAVTGTNGQATAMLSAGTSAQNRTITVTASSGSSSATIQVAVIGTTITLSGPTSLVLNTPGTYTATLTDSQGNGIAGQMIAVTSANGNTLTPTSVTTGSQGTATFTLNPSKSGNDTITASAYAGAMTATQAVSVSNQAFAITAPAANSTIAVGTLNAQTVTLTWSASGTAQSGTVNFATSRGTVSPATVTVANNTLSSPVTIYSTTAGPAVLSATAVQNGSTVASAQTALSFVAPVSTAAAISVQANPSAVATQGTSQITATVVDGTTPAPNPVQGATVDFTLTDTTGGALSAGSAVTNAAGVATVTYTAGTGTSAVNGVNIQATIQGTAITNNATLTVDNQTVALVLGTGNTVNEYSTTQYELPYTVTASDSAGHGLSGVTVTFAVQSLSYLEGYLTFVTPSWQPTFTVAAPNTECTPVQVYENNGVIKSPAPTPVPANYVLTNIPGTVATTDVPSAVTSAANPATNVAAGTATVNLIYPKDHALWVQVALTATATVSGTQNSTSASFVLPGAAADYSTQSTAPPGEFSPYGQTAACYPNAQ